VPQRRLAPHRHHASQGGGTRPGSHELAPWLHPECHDHLPRAYRPPRHLGGRPLHACHNRRLRVDGIVPSVVSPSAAVKPVATSTCRCRCRRTAGHFRPPV